MKQLFVGVSVEKVLLLLQQKKEIYKNITEKELNDKLKIPDIIQP